MVTEKKREKKGKKKKAAAGEQTHVRGNGSSVFRWEAESTVAGATGVDTRSSNPKGVISGGWKEADGKKEKQPKKKKG